MNDRALPPTSTPGFLDGRSVSRRLKLRAGELGELVQSGKVRPVDGGLYDIEEVRRIVTGSATEATIETHVSEDAQTRAVQLATQLADRTMAREGKMFETYHAGLRDVLEALRKENQALREEKGELRAENKRMHDQLLEGAKTREALISKQHERDMFEKVIEQRAGTQREGLALLKNQVWPLLKLQLERHVGANVAKQLFDSIQDAQIDALLSIDFLDDQQRALVEQLRAERAKSALPGAELALVNGAQTAPAGEPS